MDSRCYKTYFEARLRKVRVVCVVILRCFFTNHEREALCVVLNHSSMFVCLSVCLSVRPAVRPSVSFSDSVVDLKEDNIV